MLDGLERISNGRTGRSSSWDKTGKNNDRITIKPNECATLAEINGPGKITHIWMTQPKHYRECLLRMTWDHAPHASVLVPLGDFFGLGHGIVNSFESLLFTASTNHNNKFEQGCALNCYAPMSFAKHAKIELINQSDEDHLQYFYIDYETYDQPLPEGTGYFHAEFRRTNPFGGWGHEITVNHPEADAVNIGKQAWNDNYVILDTKGSGHYIGCNLSVTNFQGTWWGEGDDMIWVDGYKWPPDLHGTGSEDYLNQAWGMQANAFLRNGTSIHENHTQGYQTSYVFHLENPVRFNKQIKVTIEHGHANHLCNEMSSVGYWYASEPSPAAEVPAVAQRKAVRRTTQGDWLMEEENQCPGKPVKVTAEMRKLKKQWAAKQKGAAKQKAAKRKK